MSAFIGLTRDTSSIWFALFHWLTDIVVSGVIFGLYAQKIHQLPPFLTMVTAMLTFFVLEFIFWNFIYHGSLQLFNFTHFIFPFFLIATTIYFVTLKL